MLPHQMHPPFPTGPRRGVAIPRDRGDERPDVQGDLPSGFDPTRGGKRDPLSVPKDARGASDGWLGSTTRPVPYPGRMTWLEIRSHMLYWWWRTDHVGPWSGMEGGNQGLLPPTRRKTKPWIPCRRYRLRLEDVFRSVQERGRAFPRPPCASKNAGHAHVTACLRRLGREDSQSTPHGSSSGSSAPGAMGNHPEATNARAFGSLLGVGTEERDPGSLDGSVSSPAGVDHVPAHVSVRLPSVWGSITRRNHPVDRGMRCIRRCPRRAALGVATPSSPSPFETTGRWPTFRSAGGTDPVLHRLGDGSPGFESMGLGVRTRVRMPFCPFVKHDGTTTQADEGPRRRST